MICPILVVQNLPHTKYWCSLSNTSLKVKPTLLLFYITSTRTCKLNFIEAPCNRKANVVVIIAVHLVLQNPFNDNSLGVRGKRKRVQPEDVQLVATLTRCS